MSQGQAGVVSPHNLRSTYELGERIASFQAQISGRSPGIKGAALEIPIRHHGSPQFEDNPYNSAVA